MSKLTIGVIAGAALASVAALSPLAASGSSATDPGATVNAAAVAAGPAATSPAPVRVAAAAVAAKKVTAAATKPKPTPLPRVLKVTRSVILTLPTQGKVGSTVTGSIQVVDSNGVVSSPVVGVNVALQKQVSGSKGWIEVVNDVTDSNGEVNVSFTVKANTTWRAAIIPTRGAPVYSKTVVSTATAQLTWSTRPDLTVTHGVATSYGFRISPVTVGQAHLEYVLSGASKWSPAKNVKIPATGVVIQSLVFPKAGTYLVRGATAASASNGAGYTTLLTVVVS